MKGCLMILFDFNIGFWLFDLILDILIDSKIQIEIKYK